jgi:hypothetical protein
MSQNILACDPGCAGSFAYCLGTSSAGFFKMPDDVPGIVSLLREGKLNGRKILFIEEVGGFTKAGGSQPGSAMFKFGANFGAIIGAAVALGYEIRRVHPQKWIKAHSLGTKAGLSKTQWKNKLKTRAQEIFPNAQITLAFADSALILDAARRGLI